MKDGFDAVANAFPWPDDAALADVHPFNWALDGGGRHLINTVVASRPDAVLVEFGSFMGGSAVGFLEASPKLRMICCDPWGDNLIKYVASLVNQPWAVNSYGIELIEAYATLVRYYGPMAIVRNNLERFRDRCVLIQEGIPGVYETLKNLGLAPDIIYLDALKRHAEFWGAHQMFPDAIFTGDDWSWKDPETNAFDVRDYAAEVAKARNAVIYADRATFVISEPRHGLIIDEKYRYEAPVA